MYETKEDEEKVILIGIENNDKFMDIETSLNELNDLVKTAGAKVLGQMIQKREAIHKAHYFGKGKLEELKLFAQELGATGIVCDDDLTENQMKNMSNFLNLKIMNRTLIILDIFAKRAKSAEGKVQVELAQLKYKLSHLVGQGKALSRLGGGIGTRGPGEKKLETDRRNIANRIAELNKELKKIEKHREVIRTNRLKNKQPIVSLVGYTNAGKSTLMNKITNSNVLAMDKLFATLDTTTRKVRLNSGIEYLFTDTVGFIQKLPHNLIKAFRSTLNEAKHSDILIHVVDASSPIREQQMKIVYNTLKELNCLDKPIILAFNKMDLNVKTPLPKDDMSKEFVQISAINGNGLDKLFEKIEDITKQFKQPINVLIPYENAKFLNIIHQKCEIIFKEEKEQGIFFKLYADDETKLRLNEFLQS